MIGWLDCGSGASGDMLLGTLVDSGVPLEVIRSAVEHVAPEPIRLAAEPVRRGGFAATRVRVEVAESHTRRTWPDIRALLDDSDLAPAVRDRAAGTFKRLADAEATVHGGSADDVHFHEVGALDAIADVVGVCAGLEHLGLSALHASPVALGGGHIQAAHGTMTVPPPAVALLLRGVPTYGGPVDVELCTPTGAALLTEWVTGWGPQPAMTTATVGVGAGGRDLAGHANVLRLLLGEPSQHPASRELPTQVLLSTNIDDLDPRLWPRVLDALLAAGAADAWLTPILMKKGRPAHTLAALVPVESVAAVRAAIFAETPTIGLRVQEVGKDALDRRETTVEVAGRPVRVKLAVHDGVVVNAQPEYDDVANVASASGQPVKAVLAEAVARARALW